MALVEWRGTLGITQAMLTKVETPNNRGMVLVAAEKQVVRQVAPAVAAAEPYSNVGLNRQYDGAPVKQSPAKLGSRNQIFNPEGQLPPSLSNQERS